MIDMGEHGWPKADFGPAKAEGRRQTRPVEALRLPSVPFLYGRDWRTFNHMFHRIDRLVQ